MIPDLPQVQLLDPVVIADMATRAQSEDATVARTSALSIVSEALVRLGDLAERQHIAEAFFALSGITIELARLDQSAGIGKFLDRDRQRRHCAASIATVAESVLRAGGRS